MKEKNEEETFKEKTGKKGKNKNPEVWEDLKLQFEMPLQIPGKTDKVSFKISSEKESKLNGWKKKKNLPVFREENASSRRKYEITLRILYSTIVGQFA